MVPDRLLDGKLKGNAQFDSLDDGCGKFAISNLIRHAGFQMRQISSAGRRDCPKSHLGLRRGSAK
jgi:hypothetical protein